MLKIVSFATFLALAACGGSSKPVPAQPEPPAEGSGSATASSCTAAAGQCVPTSPTACPDGTVGDVSQYSCGSGQECCLPKK